MLRAKKIRFQGLLRVGRWNTKGKPTISPTGLSDDGVEIHRSHSCYHQERRHELGEPQLLRCNTINGLRNQENGIELLGIALRKDDVKSKTTEEQQIQKATNK